MRKLLKRFTLVLVALAILAEVGVRVAFRGRSLTAADVWEGSRLRPQTHGWLDGTLLQTDEQGLRVGDDPWDGEIREHDVVVLGGHFTAAVGQPFGAAFPAVLERLLGRHGAPQDTRVLAFAPEGLEARIERARLLLERGRPACVILQLEEADLEFPEGGMVLGEDDVAAVPALATSPSAVLAMLKLQLQVRGRAQLEDQLRARVLDQGIGSGGLANLVALVQRLHVASGPAALTEADLFQADVVMKERYAPERARRRGRARLLLEELVETIRAQGVRVILVPTGPMQASLPFRDLARFLNLPMVLTPAVHLDGGLRVRGQREYAAAVAHEYLARTLMAKMAAENFLSLGLPPAHVTRAAEELTEFRNRSQGHLESLQRNVTRWTPESLTFGLDADIDLFLLGDVGADGVLRRGERMAAVITFLPDDEVGRLTALLPEGEPPPVRIWVRSGDVPFRSRVTTLQGQRSVVYEFDWSDPRSPERRAPIEVLLGAEGPLAELRLQHLAFHSVAQ